MVAAGTLRCSQHAAKRFSLEARPGGRANAQGEGPHATLQERWRHQRFAVPGDGRAADIAKTGINRGIDQSTRCNCNGGCCLPVFARSRMRRFSPASGMLCEASHVYSSLRRHGRHLCNDCKGGISEVAMVSSCAHGPDASNLHVHRASFLLAYRLPPRSHGRSRIVRQGE